VDAKALLIEIAERFGRMTHPGEARLVLDGTGPHLECERIRRAFGGRHWRDLPFEFLDDQKGALFFMSPEGYRFYLPAFLFYSVTDFFRADTIPDEVIRTLTPPDESDIDGVDRTAAENPEMQPLGPEEWRGTLAMLKEPRSCVVLRRRFEERVSGFDGPTSLAIRRFLEHMRDAYGKEFPNQEPQTAIGRYWHRFQ